MPVDLTHTALTDLAVKWLRRPHSQKGPGCHIALSECRSGWIGEIPDAIGWRVAGHLDGSVVIEVKASRADFLADKQKPHRAGEGVGLGNWRYYLCPEGVISESDVPPKWGLLYANGRGNIKPVIGPMTIVDHGPRMDELARMRQESNYDGERFILVKLFGRIGDPDEANRRARIAYREADLARKALEALKLELNATKRRASAAMQLVNALRDEAPELVARIEAGAGIANSVFSVRAKDQV